jgi:hypothetical protein
MSAEVIPSPGLSAGPGAAYELKYSLPAALALEVEAWARGCLTPDPHGDDGRYRTTTAYCDTPRLDVYRRSPGYRRSKYRLRRYGESGAVYLERKKRRGDRVWKRRDPVAAAELACLAGAGPPAGWPGEWFLRKVRNRELSPACQVAYTRTAFIGGTVAEPLRLTLDRDLAGVLAEGWAVEPLGGGRALLPGGAILEMKFRDALPLVFRDLLALLPPGLGRVSKYRVCVRAWGLAGEEV